MQQFAEIVREDDKSFAPSIPIVISKVDAADVGNLPYCEVHRIRPLGEGGVDAPDNVACLCPARHREVHHGNAAEQIRAGLIEVRKNTGSNPNQAVAVVSS